MGDGLGRGLGWTHRVDRTLVLTLGFLDFCRTTHVGSDFIYLEEGAKSAYGSDDPVLAECPKLFHTLEGCDCGKWYPVIIVRRVETPHESGGGLEKHWGPV